jgi:cell wall-associated NlpC family hydrolase
MTKLDPRITPYRPDLAARHLEGAVEAERYVEGVARQVSGGVVDLRCRPCDHAPLESQLLGGEVVRIFEDQDGWAWLQNDTDSYVGYARSDSMSAVINAPNHVVTVPRSIVYSEPNPKAPALDALALSGSVAVVGESAGFSERAGGGWLYSRHLAPITECAPDHVATALAFLGAPYLWGGKTNLGLDCSGLVQVALHRAGMPCPRDADQQAASLGAAHPPGTPLLRGDLIYFPGHVAIALDDWRVVNANAHDMLVAIEPLADLVMRVEEISGQGVTAIRRLPNDG